MACQRVRSPGVQPVLCPSVMTTICLVGLVPRARLSEAVWSASWTSIGPPAGSRLFSTLSSCSESVNGKDVLICGIGPARTMLAVDDRLRLRTTSRASSTARAKLVFPCTSIFIDDEPSITRATSRASPTSAARCKTRSSVTAAMASVSSPAPRA